jgi:hypothetical protein
MTVVLRF